MSAAINQFSVGQSVYFSPGHQANPSSGGVFKVTRVMPWEQTGWHYHIQSLDDRHTRRAHQDQLKAMQSA